MPEFVSSLPIVGVDGTMRRRSGAAGSAHIKTGLLADTRAIAGYVLAASGQALRSGRVDQSSKRRRGATGARRVTELDLRAGLEACDQLYLIVQP